MTLKNPIETSTTIPLLDFARGVKRFKDEVFPHQQTLYKHLAQHGQRPKALMISCADSRVIPEMITQCGPGELFVCRNAGNIVPPHAQMNGGVSSAIEYAVLALGVRDIIVCGHSDCGAMAALLHPERLGPMPNVAAWLLHSAAAQSVVEHAYGHCNEHERHRGLALENVVVQIDHLRTHPSVAAGLATGKLTLHGWFFELEQGQVLAYDGEIHRFRPISDDGESPIAMHPRGALAHSGAPAAQ
jgi:carbonic anhydrase